MAAGIATLAILVAMNVFIQQTSSITRGTSTQIGVPETTSMRATLLWVIAAIVVAFAFKQSRNGLRLRASRENDRASRSVGVHVARERYIAFALSGFVCGLAGALYGHYFITFSYLDFYFDLTFLTIAMLVVGGMGSVSGAVAGTSFLTVIYVFFQRFEVNGIAGTTVPSGTADVVMALALLVALILRPRGLTAGREIPWPGDWRLPGRLRRAAAPAPESPSGDSATARSRGFRDRRPRAPDRVARASWSWAPRSRAARAPRTRSAGRRVRTRPRSACRRGRSRRRAGACTAAPTRARRGQGDDRLARRAPVGGDVEGHELDGGLALRSKV